MHNNFYFLRQLTKSLEGTLKGSVLSECFSQNKDELMLRMEVGSTSFYIRASLLPSFSCLNFPSDFHRARKNSVDLFSEIIGLTITSIRQFVNERSFTLELSDSYHLLFKMHGNRSNVILFKNDRVKEVFKKNIRGDQHINLQALDRAIDWSFEYFIAHEQQAKSIYFTFGKVVWQYLEEEKKFNTLRPEEKWSILSDTVSQLENSDYYLTTIKDIPHLSLIRTGNIIEHFDEPITAVNTFFSTYTQATALLTEKKALLSSLRSKLTAAENYCTNNLEKLRSLENDHHYKMWADLIMANLNHIRAGAERAELPNFYKNHELTEIKLKKELSPQKNAELYYKKAKNQSIEKEHLQKALINKQHAVKRLKFILAEIESLDDLKLLRQKASEFKSELKDEKENENLPYREFQYNGFKIRVGKNAAANDELTLKHAYKDDLWLHAKDVPGSHVVIKHQAGKKIPKEVIEKAAQVAAFNSKRKNESLCPVIVTPKKYVRKRKGDPPGMVVVDREEVILVEPSPLQ